MGETEDKELYQMQIEWRKSISDTLADLKNDIKGTNEKLDSFIGSSITRAEVEAELKENNERIEVLEKDKAKALGIIIGAQAVLTLIGGFVYKFISAYIK